MITYGDTKEKTKSKAASGNNGVADLMKELFQAAITLCGSIEPADYKRYVLPIIFLRFLSLRYEERREQLELMIKEPEGEYHTTDKKEIESILNDPDEYRSANAFVIPEQALWSDTLKNAQADNIKVILDDALECKAAEMLDTVLHKSHAACTTGVYAGRTWAGVA